MDNYEQIKRQWTAMDMQMYPHLFNWIGDKIKEGITSEQEKKVN